MSKIEEDCENRYLRGYIPVKIYHKRTREDLHKNTPDARAVSVRIRHLPTQTIRRGDCVCVRGAPALALTLSLYAKYKARVRVAFLLTT